MKRYRLIEFIVFAVMMTFAFLLLNIPAHAFYWDSSGNTVGANDFIGTPVGGGSILPIKIGGIKKAEFNVDGFLMSQNVNGITSLQNSNHQPIMMHVLPADCTSFYASLQNPTFQTFSLCADGFKFTGAPLIANSKYTIAPNTAYTLLPTDETVEMESGDFILPDATLANKGKRYELINTGGGQIPVQANSGQMIGNFNQEAQYIIPSGQAVTLKSNGSMWRVLQNNY